MDTFSFVPTPPQLKPCQTYMKLAADHDKLDPAVSYWCRLYALQLGLKIDPKTKDKDNKTFLLQVMIWLEEEKKRQSNNEAITNEVAGQAHLENHAMKIFLKADGEDRAGRATKATAKLFFTAAQLFDSLGVFGDLTDEVTQKSRYAKWRAAYIIKCIKSGDKPLPPDVEEGESENQPEPDSDAPENSDLGATAFPPGNPPSFGQSNDFGVGNSTNSNFASMTIKSTNTSTYQDQSTPACTGVLKALNGTQITQEDFLKTQKYCKWAGSALQYEDIPTAVANLQKALSLLTTGYEI